MTPEADDKPPIVSLGRFAAFLGIIILCRFGLVLTGIDSFFLRDFSHFGYPLATYLHDSFWDGEIPLWNPYNHCGLPFLAQWNTMVCYPPSLFICLFPVSWSLNCFCLLHLYLGGLGMFVLARRWIRDEPSAVISGTAYTFAGILLNSLLWPNNIAAFGCLPWVLLTLDRATIEGGRWLVGAAMIGALQMLTGAPEVILVTWLIFGCNWIVRSAANRKCGDPKVFATELGRILATSGLVLSLAAVQLLPFLEMLELSSRAAETIDDGWSAPSHFWANYLVPMFRSTQVPDGSTHLAGQAWIMSHYAGIGVLMLSGLAIAHLRDRMTWTWIGLVIFGLLVSLGGKGGVHDWIKHLGPLAKMRYPIKFLILPTVLLPLLAGLGFRAVTQLQWPQIRRSLLGIIALLGVGFALTGNLIAHAGGDYAASRELAWASWWRSLVWTALFAMTVLLYHQRRTILTQKRLYVIAPMLIAGDLLIHHPSLTPTVARAYWDIPVELGDEGRPPNLAAGRISSTPRAQYIHLFHSGQTYEDTLIGRRATIPPNMNLMLRVAQVEGFYSLTFPETFEVEKKLYHALNSERPAVADLLGVRQLLLENNGLLWRTRKTALPLVTAGQRPMLVPPHRIPTMLASEDYDPRSVVFLHPSAKSRLATTNTAPATISNLLIGHHRIEFDIEAAGTALAVISQSHHPAWQATVAGSRAQLLRANLAFQAISVPEGRHHVVLRYVDQQFYGGLAVSLVTLSGLLGYLWRIRKRTWPNNLGK